MHLLGSTKKTKEALIVNCGDWFHGNDHHNRTPKSGNTLDIDGRLTKIIRTGMMLMVKVIELCLTKNETVHVRNALGNHSFTLEMFMSEFLVAWFRNEPRVVIHNEPKPFWYFQFGKTLLGVTHGDTIKPTELGELMAADCTNIWSTTAHRYWLLGHVHSKHAWELRTCIVESFNTLAAKDAWHNEHGYRSKRNMTAITYHKVHGEISRNTVDVGALQ
jgi:DNA repair exonuclease SbcCD nuclease subunit